MILVQSDHLSEVRLGVSYWGENGLDEQRHDDDERGEVRNTSIDGDGQAGEQPTLGQFEVEIIEEFISPPTAFCDVLQQSFEDKAKDIEWSQEHLEDDEESLDERMSSVPENVAGPLLGQDLLAVHVTHKLLLIEFYGQPQSRIFHRGRVPQHMRRTG